MNAPVKIGVGSEKFERALAMGGSIAVLAAITTPFGGFKQSRFGCDRSLHA